MDDPKLGVIDFVDHSSTKDDPAFEFSFNLEWERDMIMLAAWEDKTICLSVEGDLIDGETFFSPDEARQFAKALLNAADVADRDHT